MVPGGIHGDPQQACFPRDLQARAYRPTREDNRLAFQGFVALYFAGGMALADWSILALVGGAPGPSLR